MNSPEIYAVVFALGPSKRDVNTLWAGSDDGVIQVTRDGGKNWSNVTPKAMPDFGRVSIIDASGVLCAGTQKAVAVKRPLLDDMAPYIFRTHDYGKTWTKIVNGIRADDYVHAVAERDPTRRGLLYAGTHAMVYIFRIMMVTHGNHYLSICQMHRCRTSRWRQTIWSFQPTVVGSTFWMISGRSGSTQRRYWPPRGRICSSQGSRFARLVVR